MPDPLTSILMGGPLDGGVVDIHPSPFVDVAVMGAGGVTHVYRLEPIAPARLSYVRSERPKAKPLVGGVEHVGP